MSGIVWSGRQGWRACSGTDRSRQSTACSQTRVEPPWPEAFQQGVQVWMMKDNIGTVFSYSKLWINLVWFTVNFVNIKDVFCCKYTFKIAFLEVVELPMDPTIVFCLFVCSSLIVVSIFYMLTGFKAQTTAKTCRENTSKVCPLHPSGSQSWREGAGHKQLSRLYW